MRPYTMQDAAEEHKESEQDDYYWRESVGLPTGNVPMEWLEGNFT